MRPMSLFALSLLSTVALAATVDADTPHVMTLDGDMPVELDAYGAHLSEVPLQVGLQAWGTPRTLQKAPPASLVQIGSCPCTAVCEQQVELVRDGLVEWWREAETGLEHGFTVHDAPGGDTLLLDVAFEGAQTWNITDDVVRVDVNGERYSYSKLVALDATGRHLDGVMEAYDGGVRLRIDVADAVYPLDIDPLLGLADWMWHPSKQNGRVGSGTLEVIGDVDGDGYEEFATKVNLDTIDAFGQATWDVLVFRGGAGGPSRQPAFRTGTTLVGQVAGADVNGDGFADLVVASPYLKISDTDMVGRVQVFHGGPEFLQKEESWRFDYNGPGLTTGGFGRKIAVGDYNGDGNDDVAVASPDRYLSALGEDAGEARTDGQVDVFYGRAPSGLQAKPSTTLVPTHAGGKFGDGLVTVNPDADAAQDLVVAAPYTTDDVYLQGWVGHYRGLAGGLFPKPSWLVRGSGYANRLGLHLLENVGDVDDDMRDDVLIGSLPQDGDGPELRLLLFKGVKKGFEASASWTHEANVKRANGSYGTLSAVGVGDTNKDGYDDILIASPHWDQSITDQGRLELFHGGATGPSIRADATMIGMHREALFGGTLATGDLNGDGGEDLLVGASSMTLDEQSEGAILAWFGDGTAPGYDVEPFGDVVDHSGSEIIVDEDVFPVSVPMPGGIMNHNDEPRSGAAGCSAVGGVPLWLGAFGLLALGVRRRR